jgi:hypothetical protein
MNTLVYIAIKFICKDSTFTFLLLLMSSMAPIASGQFQQGEALL